MSRVLYEKEQVCPICQTTFPKMMVRNSLCSVEKRDTDFRVQYRNCNPNWYVIVVCPGCGYAAPKSSFSAVGEKEREALKPVLAELGPVDLTGKRTLPQAVESFERAIKCSEVRQLSRSVMGGLYLKTAWLYREMGEASKEQQLLAKALEAYLKAYEHERDLSMSIEDLIYLIGELNRRLKRYEEAIIWFSKVIEMKDAKPSTTRLAREMWQLAREAYRRGPAEHSIEEVYSLQGADSEPEPQPAPAAEPVAVKPKRRAKVQVSTQLYVDQLDWLEKIGRWWAGEPNLDAGSCLRALLDLVSDLAPQSLQVNDEEELQQAFAEHIIAKTGGGVGVGS